MTQGHFMKDQAPNPQIWVFQQAKIVQNVEYQYRTLKNSSMSVT